MHNNDEILIIGGTGKTGKRVVQRLEEAGLPYRNGTPSSDIPFDWYQESTWQSALSGIRSVYAVFYPDLAVAGAPEIIQRFGAAAKLAGVEHIVLLSGRGEEEAQASEQFIIDSGVDWTIVRCSWFMQNFSENFFLYDILQGHLALPVSPAIREPFVDADDIADVVFAALTQPEHRGKIYELTGPELLTFKELAERIAAVTGRPIAYSTISYEEYNEGMKQAGLPDSTIEFVNYLFKEVLDGRNEHLNDGVEQALGRTPASFDAYAKRANESGAWEDTAQ